MSLITNLIDKITELVKLKLDQVKIEVKGQVAVLITRLVVIFAVGLLFTFFLFFVGLAAAYAMNHAFDSHYLGFLVVGAVALIFCIILILVAKSDAFNKAIKSKLLENED